MHSTFFFLLLSLLFPCVLPASTADWRSRSIYQVLTDRFATTNASVPECDPDVRNYCGGTWAGIIAHLDYIQNMGFDAISISPVVANLEERTSQGDAYHGYWTRDFNSLNPHFGTSEDLKALSAALHERDMYIMVDIQVNHLAALPAPTNATNVTTLRTSATTGHEATNFHSLSPLWAQDSFHPRCFITDFANQTQVEQCWVGDVDLPLPDIDTENATNFRMLNTWIGNLVREYSIDGLKLSAVQNVRKEFWNDFAASAGVFCLGEVLSDNVTYVKYYTSVLDGVIDYPSWFALSDAFASPQGNFSTLTDTVVRSQRAYSSGLVTSGAFAETSNQPRIPSLTDDASLIRNAMTWPFLHDGIPITFYGQEYAFSGGVPPANHEALWPTDYKTYHQPLVEHLSALNGARGLAIKSQQNFLTSPMTFIPQEESNALVVSKGPLLGLLTNVGNNSLLPTTWTIGAETKLFLKGQSLVDVLTCKSYVVDPATGDLVVQSEYGLPAVILPTNVLDANEALCADMAPPSSKNSGTQNAPRYLLFILVLSVLLL